MHVKTETCGGENNYSIKNIKLHINVRQGYNCRRVKKTIRNLQMNQMIVVMIQRKQQSQHMCCLSGAFV